jgi:hypothetical protein
LVSRRLRLLAALPAAFVLVAVGAVQPFHSTVRQASASPLEKIEPRLRAHVSGTAQMELQAAPQAQARAQGSN